MNTLAVMPRTASSKTIPAKTVPKSALGSLRPLTNFETEAVAVLSELAVALRRLIEALPAPVERSGDLQKILKVKYNTAWRTLTVIRADPPVSAGVNVPTPRQIRQLLDAAARVKVKSMVLERVRNAYDAFEELVQRHAGRAVKSGSSTGKVVGGRAIFDAMLGGLDGEAAAQQDISHRRSAFKANSYDWGMQQRAHLATTIYHPGANPGEVDGSTISGYIQLHAVRRNVAVRLMRRAGSYDPADPKAAAKPALPYQDTVLLHDFSTSPLPPLHTNTDPTGMLETNLEFDEVGKASAIDIFMTSITRNMYGYQPQPWFGTSVGASIPREVGIVDVLVPRGWTDPTTVRASRHGHVSLFESIGQRIPEFVMPMSERPAYLGSDLSALESAEIPRYTELTKHVLQLRGWTDTEFDIFRLRLIYPTMHTWVHMRVSAVKP